MNSLHSEIRRSVLSHENAQTLWKELKRRFGQANAVRIANLQDEINACKQGSLSVTQYYTVIKGLWEEYSQYSPIVPCPCLPGSTNVCPAVVAFQEKQDTDYLIRFLKGLNAEYDVVKTQLLMMKPLPSVAAAFDDVLQHEEKLKGGVTIGRGATSQPAVFAVSANQESTVQAVNRTNFQAGKVCRYCKKDGHVIEDCMKLKWKRKQENQGGNNVGPNRFAGAVAQGGNENVNQHKFTAPTSAQSFTSFSAEEMNKLKALLQSAPAPAPDSSQQHRAFSVSQGLSNPPNYSGKYILSIASCLNHDNVWILDTGASDHITCSIHNFIQYKPVHNVHVYLPNSTKVNVSHIGSVKLPIGPILHNVLLIPDFQFNLISISKLTHDLPVSLTFSSNQCELQDLITNKTIGLASELKGLYHLHNLHKPNTKPISTPSHQVAASINLQHHDINLWHWRLGHPSNDRLKLLELCNNDIVNEKVLHCEVCHLAKQKRLPFPASSFIANDIFDLIHVDIWGPLAVQSYDGFSYFLTIVDDYSRGVWIYLMKNKGETRTYLQNFCQMIQNQFEKKVKTIRSDQGKEFHMTDFFNDHGIIHQMSCVQTPEQNARVERKHQHILNVARSLKFQSGISLEHWSDCVLHAVYLINRIPTPVLQNQSPYERLFKSPPSFKDLKVFGCLCYASTISHNRTKFQPRATQCVFLGIPVGIKGFKVMDIDSQKVFISRDVVFHEDIIPYKHNSATYNFPSSPNTHPSCPEPVLSSPPLHSVPTILSPAIPDQIPHNQIQSDAPNSFSDLSGSSCHLQDVLTDNEEEMVVEAAEDDQVPDSSDLNMDNTLVPTPALRRSTRERRAPIHLLDYHLSNTVSRHSLAASVSYANLSDEYRRFALSIITQQEPNSYGEAKNELCWVNAMKDELAAMEENHTWDLVPLPEGKRTVGCRWVYRIKYRSDGTVERHKARLVAKGFTQIYGIDFLDTFSPVAKINSVKTLLAVASIKGWHLQQMDVSNAFLHGDLDEEVYMQVPDGLDCKPGMCCKLRKSLYGLKQASRQWFAKLANSLTANGFRQSTSDYSLFVKGNGEHTVVLLVYVDDIILAGNNVEEIEEVKSYLKSVFKIKDLGSLKYFLGLEVSRSSKGIVINQRKYCIELLNDAGFLEAKDCKTPMEVNTKFRAKEGEPLPNPADYRALIGKLHYLTITRPDIAFVVQQLSQFQSDPYTGHMSAAHRVLRYLKMAPGQGLFYRADSRLELKGFCDSDWATCPDTRRSVTGYCTYLGDNLLTWKSKKQTTVSRSSSEAEYRALAHLVCEVQWLTVLLKEIGVQVPTPVEIQCDNRSAIHIAENPVFHERTKHIEIDCHVTRERIKSGLVKLCHVSTEKQLADIFTKGLHRRRLHFLLSKLGVLNVYSPTCGRLTKEMKNGAGAGE
ncbi:Retrovirus-related Pol polyprotein from transposon TNT 1-94 [Linum perenne]